MVKLVCVLMISLYNTCTYDEVEMDLEVRAASEEITSHATATSQNTHSVNKFSISKLLNLKDEDDDFKGDEDIQLNKNMK